MSFIKRQDIGGKKVIGPDGNLFGTVKDIAFSIEGDIGLVIEKAGGGETTIPMQKVTGVGEFILLGPETGAAKPLTQPRTPSPTVAGGNICPSCGTPNKLGAKFCAKCGTKVG